MELSTKYGRLVGCIECEYYEEGNIKSCRFTEENTIQLKCGRVVPQYGDEGTRKKYIKAIGFYKNGTIKKIALQQQTKILTPIGEFPAELLTFYEDGAIKRIFPLNGKISGFWSEKDEEGLAIPVHIQFGTFNFFAKIISIYFYNSGKVKSITLFPAEVISILTPLGTVQVRTGFSLYENGEIKSLEPAVPVQVMTKIGKINAFDMGATGIHADDNSLKFSEDGQVQSVVTSSDKIIVECCEGSEMIQPILKPSPLDEEEWITMPVTIGFDKDNVSLTIVEQQVYSLENTSFTIYPSQNNTCFSCSDCSVCGKCR